MKILSAKTDDDGALQVTVSFLGLKPHTRDMFLVAACEEVQHRAAVEHHVERGT